jgi:hypothetical protein
MTYVGENLKEGYARDGELGGIRTHDPRIKSALLYRLSYELTKEPLLSKLTQRIDGKA